MNVKRLYRTLPTTPAAADEGAWKVQVMCEACMSPKVVRLTHDRWARWWSFDFEDIFKRVTFRCRCGKLAHAMRISRRTRDDSEVLLLLSRGREPNALGAGRLPG